MASIFNPKKQEGDTASKIVAGLERISEAFKVLLWEKAKVLGLSPIQIQLLIFMAYHKQDLCKVSHLAKEFNVTKPTISDAIRMLDKKELIKKDYSSADSRSYSILLSEKGKKIVQETENFASPIKDQLTDVSGKDLEALFSSLSTLIYQLNKVGILSVQRTCYGCKFYQKKAKSDYCKLLNKDLFPNDIRLDCGEYEEKSKN